MEFSLQCRIQPGGKEVGTIKHTQERGGLGNHAELIQVKSKVKLEEKSCCKKNNSIRLESRVCQDTVASHTYN
jgi:hypothetical protein